MYPIKEYVFESISSDLKREFFQIHNQVIKDLTVLSRSFNKQDVDKYLKYFFQYFNEIKNFEKSVSNSFIFASRYDLEKLASQTSEKIPNKYYDIDTLIKLSFSNRTIAYLKKKKKNATKKIGFKQLTLVIFNYGHNRDTLLKYYSKNNHLVCSYCLAQYTAIYKSKTRKRYYLTGQLDHILPKDSYPLLSLSINNLIPVCASCNGRKSKYVLTYDPFNMAHKHSFDFDECIDYNKDKGKIIYKSLDNMEIVTRDDRYADISRKLDYKDLYSNFEDIAKNLVERYQHFSSVGYKSSLEKSINSKELGELIDYLISEVQLSDENVLKYPLTKFKMDLYNTIKGKVSGD